MGMERLMEAYNTKIIADMIAEITAKRVERGVKMKGGKTYTMVQDRVETLRRVSGDYYRIHTEMLQWGSEDGACIVVRALIRTPDGQVVATGHAEEVRGSSQITDTSAIEVCETSAIGRALAVLGIHGGEFASAEELAVVVDKLDKKQRRPAPVVAPVGTGDGRTRKDAGPIADVGVVSSPTKPSALVHVDIEELIGGPPNGVHNAQIMKDVREDVAAQVATINGRTPVLKPTDDMNMVAECFFTFMPLCNSVEETYSFWYANESLIKKLEADDNGLYLQVRERFIARRNELSRGSNGTKEISA